MKINQFLFFMQMELYFQETVRIMNKVIKIAIKNGWKDTPWYEEIWNLWIPDEVIRNKDAGFYATILFEHNFLKNFFGKRWKYHASKMILYKRGPINYIKNFLNK